MYLINKDETEHTGQVRGCHGRTVGGDVDFSNKVSQQVAVQSSHPHQASEDMTNLLFPTPTLGVLCVEDVPREMLGLLPGWGLFPQTV